MKLDSIYVFVPDISVFKDTFTLNPENERQRTAKAFFNFLADQTEKCGGFKFLRTPVEFTVKLINDPLFRDKKKVWGLLGLILKAECSVFNPNVSTEEEIMECYNTLEKYKKPILISNERREVYQGIEISTVQFMNIFKNALLTDRSFIRK